MNILLLVSNHCDACQRAIIELDEIKSSFPKINTEIMNINRYEDERIFITPALIVNGELFSYGDINKEKLLAKII